MFKKIMAAFSKEREERVAPGQEPGSVEDASPTPADDPAPAEADAGAGNVASQESAASAEPIENAELCGRIEDALRTIYDPEIPVNIYDIGLIYEIVPRADETVYVKMTLTSPSCPAAGILPGQVESKVRSVEGVKDCELDLVFDPPWSPDRMSEAARLELGMM